MFCYKSLGLLRTDKLNWIAMSLETVLASGLTHLQHKKQIRSSLLFRAQPQHINRCVASDKQSPHLIDHCCLHSSSSVGTLSFYFQLIHNGVFQGHKALGLNQELSESNKPEFSRRTDSQMRWKWQSFLTKSSLVESSHKIHPLLVVGTGCTYIMHLISGNWQ